MGTSAAYTPHQCAVSEMMIRFSGPSITYTGKCLYVHIHTCGYIHTYLFIYIYT